MDIRLVDDDDEKDISGITLAKDPTFRSIPKIILTNFPTIETVRDVLGVATDGLPAAVEFLWKAEGTEAMLESVSRSFAWHIRVNWDLRICWNTTPPLSFLHFASTLQPDLTGEIWMQRALELETLFRRLFRAYREIWIGQILWHTHHRFCLPVLACSAEGVTDNRILVCDARGELMDEVARVQNLAPETVTGIRPVAQKTTVHFGAVLYQTPHLHVETAQTWRKFFEVGKERPLKMALRHLLKKSLHSWHRHGEMLDTTHDLMTLYRRRVGLEGQNLNRETIKDQIDQLVLSTHFLSDLEIESGDEKMLLRLRGHAPFTCPHPIEALYASPLRPGQPVVCRVSPGRLTADNLLVDAANHHVWPTDFAEAGQAPQWWDFVCLEAAIRFDMRAAPDLMGWYDFEKCLTDPQKLNDRLRKQGVPANLQTNVALIEQIRWQASRETGPDVLPYYAGLLTWVVAAIVAHNAQPPPTSMGRMRAVHLLLAAALLTKRLNETAVRDLVPPGGALRLDDDGQVFIGEKRLPDELTVQERALLRCLYMRAGKSVSRQTIVQEVFGESYQQEDEHLQSRINALVRRLRQKIEPNPARPRYLITVKGTGYRLRLNGEK